LGSQGETPEGLSRFNFLPFFQLLSEFFETKMRNEFLFCKQKKAMLLSINPDREVAFLGRIGN
jgi:hypothetical protein